MRFLLSEVPLYLIDLCEREEEREERAGAEGAPLFETGYETH